MKKTILILLLIAGTLTVSAKQKVDQQQLDSLYNIGARMAEYGRFEDSNEYYQAMLKVYKMSLFDKFKIYSKMAINYNLMGDYQMMYKYLRKIHSEDELKRLKPLSLLPKDAVERPFEDVTVEYQVDSLYDGEMFGGCEISIPVTIGGREEMMVLDNGMAKYSTVNESFALSHGIRPIGYEGETSGVIDESRMWLGIADSLMVGGMKFKNMVFTVVPDDNITNKVLPYDGYLGANFFRLAGEMNFNNHRRTITFPFGQVEHTANLTINDVGEHFAVVKMDDRELRLHFDMGCSQTSLGAKYYYDFKDEVERTCRASVMSVNGIGGSNTMLCFYKRNPRMYFNGALFAPKTMFINTVKDHNEDEEYGKLGNDFVLSFARVTLNLRKMYMTVE